MTSTMTTPTVLSMMVSVSASSPAASTWPCFHCLSPEETAHKRKKGECYFSQKSSRRNTSVHPKGVFSWNWKTIWPSSLMSLVCATHLQDSLLPSLLQAYVDIFVELFDRIGTPSC
jgi:hypothetical protein